MKWLVIGNMMHPTLRTARLIQLGARQQSLQAGVLLLQLLQPLRLVHAQIAVFLPPPHACLRRYADLLRRQLLRCSLRRQYLRFAEIGNDLFRSVLLCSSGHRITSLKLRPDAEIIHHDADSFKEAGSLFIKTMFKRFCS